MFIILIMLVLLHSTCMWYTQSIWAIVVYCVKTHRLPLARVKVGGLNPSTLKYVILLYVALVKAFIVLFIPYMFRMSSSWTNYLISISKHTKHIIIARIECKLLFEIRTYLRNLISFMLHPFRDLFVLLYKLVDSKICLFIFCS